jgi:hypothetical protein
VERGIELSYLQKIGRLEEWKRGHLPTFHPSKLPGFPELPQVIEKIPILP